MSEVLEVGKQLVELCRQGKYVEAIDRFYSPDIVSIEAASMDPSKPRRMQGIKPIREKSEWWVANHEIHSHEVLGPWPHDDRFITVMRIDVTAKTGPMAGQRMQFEEACLYTVKNGKIVQEEFFYNV